MKNLQRLPRRPSDAMAAGNLVLGIDTGGAHASAALVRDGAVLCSGEVRSGLPSESVLEVLREMLSDAGVPLAEVSLVAVGIGPGSFTGIRTASSLGLGLGCGTGCRLVGVPLLLAACWKYFGDGVSVVAEMPASVNDNYFACYHCSGRGADGRWKVLEVAPAQSAPGAAIMGLVRSAVEHCGLGSSKLERIAVDPASPLPAAENLAALAALCASGVDARNGEGLPLLAAQPWSAVLRPIYVKGARAKTIAERRGASI